MKPTSFALPLYLGQHLFPEVARAIVDVGNAALLDEPLLGFISFRTGA